MCSCPQECDMMSISTAVSTSDYPSVVYASALKNNSKIRSFFGNRTNVTQDELRRNLLSFTIFYNHLIYTRYSELEKLNIIDLISSIGGTLGLFLGMSFLSFVEIIDLFLQLFLADRERPKKVTKVMSAGKV